MIRYRPAMSPWRGHSAAHADRNRATPCERPRSARPFSFPCAPLRATISRSCGQTGLLQSLCIRAHAVLLPHETVEKVSGNAAGGPYEDVLRGNFPLFYLALYSVIAFTHAFVPSRATRSWRKVTLRQKPHQPFQILGGRGQQELFGDIPQST